MAIRVMGLYEGRSSVLREREGGSIQVWWEESGKETMQRSCCWSGALFRRGSSIVGLGKKATEREHRQRHRGESGRAALENGTCAVCRP